MSGVPVQPEAVLRYGREVMAQRLREAESMEPTSKRQPFGRAVVTEILEARLVPDDPARQRAKVLRAAAACLALLEQIDQEKKDES